MERNALRANLVARTEDWRWGSLWRRQRGGDPEIRLHDGPLAVPRNWVKLVNTPQTEGELAAVRHAAVRGSPYGSAAWRVQTAQRMGLQATLRPEGRPRKPVEEETPMVF